MDPRADALAVQYQQTIFLLQKEVELQRQVQAGQPSANTEKLAQTLRALQTKATQLTTRQRSLEEDLAERAEQRESELKARQAEEASLATQVLACERDAHDLAERASVLRKGLEEEEQAANALGQEHAALEAARWRLELGAEPSHRLLQRLHDQTSSLWEVMGHREEDLHNQLTQLREREQAADAAVAEREERLSKALERQQVHQALYRAALLHASPQQVAARALEVQEQTGRARDGAEGLKSDVAQLQAQLQDAAQERQAKDQEVQQLQRDVRQLAQQVASHAQVGRALRRAEMEQEHAQRRRTLLQQQKEHLEAEVSGLEGELRRVAMALHAHFAQHVPAPAASGKEQLQRRQQEVEGHYAQFTATTKELNSVNTQLSVLKDETTQLEDRLQASWTELQRATQETQQLADSVEAERRAADDLARLKHADAEHARQHEASLSIQRQALQGAEAAAAQARSEATKLSKVEQALAGLHPVE